MVAVALGGSDLVDIALGSRALVLGQGLIGQCAAQIAAARGATVVASEPSPLRSRLSSARTVLDPSDPLHGDRLAGLLGDGADLVVESTGRADLVGSCLAAMRLGGQILLQGYYKEPLVIDFHPWHVRQPHVPRRPRCSAPSPPARPSTSASFSTGARRDGALGQDRVDHRCRTGHRR